MQTQCENSQIGKKLIRGADDPRRVKCLSRLSQWQCQAQQAIIFDWACKVGVKLEVL